MKIELIPLEKMIYDIKDILLGTKKEDEVFKTGYYIESKLFNKKMKVWIDNNFDIEYAEKCVSNFLIR